MINKVPNKIKELIILAQQGDIVARNKVIEFVFPFWQSVCNDNDVLQNAVIRLIKYLHTFDMNKGNFLNWSFVVLSNVRKRSFEVDQKNPETAFSYFSKESQYYFTEINKTTQKDFEFNSVDLNTVLSYVKEIVEGLKPAQRKTFELWAFEGLKHIEIAEILNVHEGSSKSNLNRAKEKIRKELKRRYNYEQN